MNYIKKFQNKHVIDLNEEEDGSFDILRVMYYKADPPATTAKKDYWQLITYDNDRKLSICTCSELYFGSLKILGEAKNKVIKIPEPK